MVFKSAHYFFDIDLLPTFSGIDGKSLHKSETLRITKWKNKMKLQKHLSEDSLKSVNGESVNVPVDQYKKLLNAQQVSR